ncbi:MAG: hypothetical protein AB7P07_14005 [Hyphomonadaceae bacterium]
MKRWTMAAAAALMLAACNQGGGPALPPVQDGAQAPSTQQPQPTTQQANITDEVRQQLIQNINDMLNQMQQASGLAQAEGVADAVQPMQPGTDHRAQVALNAGTAYTIVGACDGDCTNMDIELIDMSTGGVVASDMLPDDFPVVQYTPQANGSYIVRLLMQACSVAPCYGGARVLSGGGASLQPAMGQGAKPS